MDNGIVLFDIPGRSPIPYSPNTWKVRLVLNYKGIAYSTRYVEIADIEDTCKFLDIPPSGTRPTGGPHFTFPAIIDNRGPNGAVKISDSKAIIEYLERTYPSREGKELFPEGTREFQDKVQEMLLTRILSHAPFLWLLDLYRIKTPRDQQNIKTRMETQFGKPIHDIVAKGQEWQHHWEEVKQALSDLETLALDNSKSEGPFLLGHQLTFSDVVMGAFLICLKNSAPEEQWDQVALWNNGLWTRLLKALEPWMEVDDYPVWKD